MNKDILDVKNDLAYWVSEAKEIIEMIEDDEISSALKIASYVRNFYIEGKKHGVWEWNNSER